MAVKHVTIYQCDACSKEVAGNCELTKLTLGARQYDLCPRCTHNVRCTLEPKHEEDTPCE